MSRILAILLAPLLLAADGDLMPQGYVNAVSGNTTATCVGGQHVVYAVSGDGFDITLPARASGNDGCMITIISADGDGTQDVGVSPDASDSIIGSVLGGSTLTRTLVDGAAGADVNCTQATQIQGDYLTLIAVPSDGWYIIGGRGIWQHE